MIAAACVLSYLVLGVLTIRVFTVVMGMPTLSDDDLPICGFFVLIWPCVAVGLVARGFILGLGKLVQKL